MIDFLRALKPAAVPAGVLAAAALLAALAPPLPASLSGLHSAAPYVLLVTATVLAWWFNRGRSFVLASSLLAGFAGYTLFPSRTVYTFVALLVPLNAAIALFRPERGARHGPGWRWLALLAGELLLVAWAASAGKQMFSGTAWNAMLEHWLLRAPPMPLAARLVFAAAFGAALWRAWPDYKPLPVGNAGALAGFFAAVFWLGAHGVFSIFMAAAGLVLTVSLLQESHQLAFRDQLTGLPGRRALDERLRSLRGRYAVAMVDVDHFKQFNDTHGHDIGDQVLRLVAGRLAEVGGGGRAYRYGGEEFSVLFPERGADEIEQDLEAIRGSIERYRMAVRGEDRPKKAEEGAKRRGARAADKLLSVTVSIGLAEPSASLANPQQVVKAADEALYRAKRAGRNRLSR